MQRLLVVLALIASATLAVAPPRVSAHESRMPVAETGAASAEARSVTGAWHAADLRASAPAPATGRHAISATRRSARATSWGLIAALSIVVATALAIPARVRRGVAVTAVVALAWFVFETGEHSTHHLGDERGAARCTVSSTSAKIAAAEQAPPTSTVTLAPAPTRVSEIAEKDPAVCPLPVPPGRAPPLPR